MAESYYTPGVCNINPKEVASRRNIGIGFGMFGMLCLIGVIAFKAPTIYGILLFIPFWISALSFLQAKNHFCVNYAAQGKYNTSDQMGAVADADAEQHKQDKKRARKMHMQAIFTGVVCAVITCVILQVI